MATEKSTRLAIVEQSIADILERLKDLPLTPRIRELRAKALSYERRVKAWPAHPPSEEQRAAMLRCVLELNVAVMEAARKPPAP